MRLAVGDALLAPRELGQLAVDLVLLGEDALLDLDDLGPALGDLLLDLRAELHRLLARLDLSLAPHRLCLAASLGEEKLPRPARRREAGACDRTEGDEGERRPYDQADQGSDDNEHGRSCRAPTSGMPRIGCLEGLRTGPGGRYFNAVAASRKLVRSGTGSRLSTDCETVRCRQIVELVFLS